MNLDWATTRELCKRTKVMFLVYRPRIKDPSDKYDWVRVAAVDSKAVSGEKVLGLGKADLLK